MYGLGGSVWLSKLKLRVLFCVKEAVHLVRYCGILLVVMIVHSLLGSVLLNAPEISFARRHGWSGVGLPGFLRVVRLSDAM